LDSASCLHGADIALGVLKPHLIGLVLARRTVVR
jgi:hypothetical protein